MEKSDDLLASGLKILGDTPSNRQHLIELLELLKPGSTGRLIPFVGAGLSIEFAYPTWTKLLADFADEVGLTAQIDSQLANYQFEEAAEILLTKFPGDFKAKLRNIFDKERLPKPLGRGAVRHVTRIARGLVLTTNFDCVLEQAFEDAGRPLRVFAGSRLDAASHAIQTNDRTLLKIHGDYYDPESRVLTLTEYRHAYGNVNPEEVNRDLALPKILRQAFGAGTMLFVGCSLNVDRTTRVLAEIARDLPGTTQFALLPETADQARRIELDSWNILPLFFPAGEFDRVDKFLAFLAEAIGEGDRLPVSAVSASLTGEKVDYGGLVENWRAQAAADNRLTEFLPLQGELLGSNIGSESRYFSSANAEQSRDRVFRPVVFRPFGATEFDEITPDLIPKILVEGPGLTIALADFAADICESLRWIRHSLCTDKEIKNTPVAWVSGRFLTEPTSDRSARFVRSELLEAPLDRAILALQKLNHHEASTLKARTPDALVMLIDFSEFDLGKTLKQAPALGNIFERMIELHETLRSNHQTLVLGLPRHFLLLSDMTELLGTGNAWVSSALFSQAAEDRRDQMQDLLKRTHLPSSFMTEVSGILAGNFQSSKIKIEAENFPPASFLRCNSNTLIYAIVAELVRIKNSDRWLEKLSEGLARRGFWDPAIRLSQVSSTLADEDFQYLSRPVDIVPSNPGGIYGYLNGVEEIPFAAPESVLYSEAGGGKTTALKAIEHVFSLPRPEENRTPAAWLPVEVSGEMNPANSLISRLISMVATRGIECLFHIVSSPLYLLVEDVERVPDELDRLRAAARSTGSRLGVLLARRSFPGADDRDDLFARMKTMKLRPLTPKTASHIAGKPMGDLLMAWSMIDLPQSRLCQNPFMLHHCAAALLRGENTNEDRALTDILAEAIEGSTPRTNANRREEIFGELLPLLAIRGLRSQKLQIDSAEFTKALTEESLLDAYDMGWLRYASAVGALIQPDKGRDTYVFRHTIYQEYFAAVYLAQNEKTRLRALEEANRRPRGRRWYNCLRLMMPLLSEPLRNQVLEFAGTSHNTELFGMLLSGLRPSQLRKLLFAAAPAVILKEESPKNEIERTFVELCNAPSRDGLASLGLADPRILPLTFSRSEATAAFGEALAQRIEDERWGKRFQLNGTLYQIGRYPVTNLEFHRFVKEGGYQEKGRKHFDSEYVEVGAGSKVKDVKDMQPAGPRYWALATESRSGLREPNCPVVGVSLYEARAYCRWLSERTGDGHIYRIPTAPEWTYVAYARWPSARYSVLSVLTENFLTEPLLQRVHALCVEDFRVMIEQVGPELANTGPVPVGAFFDGESSCADLFGNVWEWCDTSLDKTRVCVRGGPRPTCSLQSLLFEGVFTPNGRSELVGFRVLRELH